MSERTARRFPVQLPATIRTSKKSTKAKGTTADMSVAGAYITADANLKVGSKIEFDITLPGHEIGSKKDVIIRCKGRVVRTDTGGNNSKARKGRGKGGLACVIDEYEFKRK